MLGDGRATSRRVVVVTGGSAGVGRAAAEAFARRGNAVAVLARGRERLDAARRELSALGVPCLGLRVDVADAAAVDDAATRVEGELGPIDVWVNNAMTSVFSPVAEVEASEVQRVDAVNYLGSVNGILAALPRMRERDAGTIVQVGSALSYRAIPLQAAYCASKFAIRGFVDSLRCELRHDASSVRVTSVHLPAVNTPQFEWVRTRLPRSPQPVAPIYQPQVAARAIEWASRHPRREVWVGGSTVGTIVANRLAPGLLDRYLARTGFESQQTEEPVAADREDNLWEPAAGDFGARGRFDDRARASSIASRAGRHRRLLAAAAATTAGAVATAVRSR